MSNLDLWIARLNASSIGMTASDAPHHFEMAAMRRAFEDKLEYDERFNNAR